jgi:hypothetical protein
MLLAVPLVVAALLLGVWLLFVSLALLLLSAWLLVVVFVVVVDEEERNGT